jgi:hypothetical protein
MVCGERMMAGGIEGKVAIATGAGVNSGALIAPSFIVPKDNITPPIQALEITPPIQALESAGVRRVRG